ncbi:MAG: integrin alpha [Phycisphaerales bacterium]
MTHRFVAAALTTTALAAPAFAQFVEPATIIHSWSGESANDQFGFINRNLGDVDGDGINDIGVGVPIRDEGGNDAGKAYIYSGATGALIRAHVGDRANAGLGYEMGGVGDLNNDGANEYVIGAPDTAQLGVPGIGPGRALLFDGATGALLHTWTGENTGDIFGNLVAGCGNVLNDTAGDVDGDGVFDILVCAAFYNPGTTGRAYVYSGADYTPIHIIDAPTNGGIFGLGAGGIGDITGDGKSELVIAAPGASTGGLAFVYDGATGAQLPFSPLVPDATAAFFGNLFASGPGDIDADGTPDIFISDLGDDENGNNAGKSYVFSGADGSRILTIPGPAAEDQFGVGRGCGDANGDGVPDFIIASYISSAFSPQAGRAFLVSGTDGRFLRSITRRANNQLFGWSCVGAGDLNADGYPDFAISSLTNGGGANPQRGRVYVIAGEPEPLCVADCDANAAVNIDDIDCFVAAFLAADPISADCDQSGTINLDDLDCFVATFLAGCP